MILKQPSSDASVASCHVLYPYPISAFNYRLFKQYEGWRVAFETEGGLRNGRCLAFQVGGPETLQILSIQKDQMPTSNVANRTGC